MHKGRSILVYYSELSTQNKALRLLVTPDEVVKADICIRLLLVFDKTWPGFSIRRMIDAVSSANSRIHL